MNCKIWNGPIPPKLFVLMSTVFLSQDIAVIKIVSDDGETFGCFASPLNDKDAASPSAVRKSFDEGDEQVHAIDNEFIRGSGKRFASRFASGIFIDRHIIITLCNMKRDDMNSTRVAYTNSHRRLVWPNMSILQRTVRFQLVCAAVLGPDNLLMHKCNPQKSKR